MKGVVGNGGFPDAAFDTLKRKKSKRAFDSHGRV